MPSSLLDQGHRIETLQHILGHAKLVHVDPCLQVSKERLRQDFANVL